MILLSSNGELDLNWIFHQHVDHMLTTDQNVMISLSSNMESDHNWKFHQFIDHLLTTDKNVMKF